MHLVDLGEVKRMIEFIFKADRVIPGVSLNPAQFAYLMLPFMLFDNLFPDLILHENLLKILNMFLGSRLLNAVNSSIIQVLFCLNNISVPNSMNIFYHCMLLSDCFILLNHGASMITPLPTTFKCLCSQFSFNFH